MKFFVVSDIHGFYDEFIDALNKAGFDKNNKNHWLVSCGDEFDRGEKSVKVMNFLMNLERKILIRGNHMQLLEELCMRGFPYSYDKSNGTFKTVIAFGDFDGYNFEECCNITFKKTARYRKLLVNYFETQNYIFVHSFIPTIKIGYDNYEYKENWREATDQEWETAMWGNCINMALDGLNKTGKTIVMGHYHCSYGHLCDSEGEISEFGEDAIWEPWRRNNCIAIDRCVAHTGEVNVLVIEDEFDTNWLNKYEKEFE